MWPTAVAARRTAVAASTRRYLRITLRCRSALADYIPDSVRDAVKSTVLEEATRPDSTMWATKTTTAAANGARQQSQKLQQQQQHEMNGHASSASPATEAIVGGSINDPTYGERSNIGKNDNHPDEIPSSSSFMIWQDDPLDDWYLNRKPKLLNQVSNGDSMMLPPSVTPLSATVDPFRLAADDMERLAKNIRRDLIGSDHPVLESAAAYFFEQGRAAGKKVRPMMVLLLSRAMANHHQSLSSNSAAAAGTAGVDIELMAPPLSWQRPDLPQAQQRLAEISEMIHTASLFHDDVIDGADTRRGAPAVHKVFGNKMAILAGDYLLARASICLARLRNIQVVEAMSTIIEHLVRGEVMQMKGSQTNNNTSRINSSAAAAAQEERLVYYLRKNFYKTGSLMAHSCKSAALLGGYDDNLVSAAYRYGKHVGMAFQLVDDVLDFEGSQQDMGKPALSDLRAGIATAPVLFASLQYHEELMPMMERKFSHEGDVERAVELVRSSNGLARTKELAQVYAELAMEAVLELKKSDHRDALVHLAYKVVDRTR